MQDCIPHSVVLAMIQDEVQRLGSQKAFAADCDISEQYLSDVLNGRRNVGPAIADFFNLRPVTVFLERDADA